MPTAVLILSQNCKSHYKECYETEYWIEISCRANIITADSAKRILHDCGSIRRMLIASLNTAKGNHNEAK